MENSRYEEKYEGISTASMIKVIQERAIIAKSATKKPARTKRIIAQSGEIAEMKSVVRARLSRMDRTSALFFPIGSHVYYSSPKGVRQSEGIVLEHYFGKCRVKFKDQAYDLSVEPELLTLLYLR